MNAPVIGFAGLTHLGVNSAAGALSRGFRVVGYDADQRIVEGLARGQPQVVEPGLPEALADGKTRARFSADVTALAACDVVYIAADVPTDDRGASDLGGIRSLIEQVIPALAPHAPLVVLCQVPPGFTRTLGIAPSRLYCQVETLVFGRALDRAVNPERFIVGCADPETPLAAPLQQFLAAYGCPILPMAYESAELAKIAINCCLVSSISVANTLAELCERIGADWSEIAPALKLDKRIGAHAYLTPGLGIAGGNLERDLATVVRLAEEHRTDAGVVKAWRENSRHRRDWAARTAREVVLNDNPAAVLAVWGLAYKENTQSTKNSPSFATIARLQDATLRVHDPVVAASAARHPRATGCDEALQAVEGADALLILTPWPQYRSIAPAAIAQAMRGRVVLDPYAVLDAVASMRAGLLLHTLGRGAPDA
jgi:UDPglucose 6-dehydrogenase